MKKSFRRSPQRDAVLEVLQSTTSHPTAEWICEQAKQRTEISLGTVYRNLKQLCDANVIRTVVSDDGVEHYDANAAEHCHFICKRCNRIYDAPAELQVRFLEKTFDYETVDVQFHGVCDKCKEKSNQNNRREQQ